MGAGGGSPVHVEVNEWMVSLVMILYEGDQPVEVAQGGGTLGERCNGLENARVCRAVVLLKVPEGGRSPTGGRAPGSHSFQTAAFHVSVSF
jgi:hypothetical protein